MAGGARCELVKPGGLFRCATGRVPAHGGSTRVSCGFNSDARSFRAVLRGPAAPARRMPPQPGRKCCLACRTTTAALRCRELPGCPEAQDRSAGPLPAGRTPCRENFAELPHDHPGSCYLHWVNIPEPGISPVFACSSPRTHKYPIYASFRACWIVTRAQASASAGRSAFPALCPS